MMKTTGHKPDVGLYFVPAGGGGEVKVDSSDIVASHTVEVIAMIPALPTETPLPTHVHL
ncbi:MAG: hypothetical protein LBK73_11515 [Treponema sp.]|jgi:hypothetical protein|nr:hypothetical protein [Treponema sp.]